MGGHGVAGRHARGIDTVKTFAARQSAITAAIGEIDRPFVGFEWIGDQECLQRRQRLREWRRNRSGAMAITRVQAQLFEDRLSRFLRWFEGGSWRFLLA
jgi:hypothetical protein